jgi:hypothetical protein
LILSFSIKEQKGDRGGTKRTLDMSQEKNCRGDKGGTKRTLDMSQEKNCREFWRPLLLSKHLRDHT